MSRHDQVRQAIADRYPEGANLTAENMLTFFEKIWSQAYAAGVKDSTEKPDEPKAKETIENNFDPAVFDFPKVFKDAFKGIFTK